VWTLNEVPIKFKKAVVQMLPRHYSGRWRMIFDTKYNENNIQKRECKMGHGDVFV